jgi:hypothetical protein
MQRPRPCCGSKRGACCCERHLSARAQACPRPHPQLPAHSVASLEAEAIELHLPSLAPERGQEGKWLHLGRGHMTLMARQVRGLGALEGGCLAHPGGASFPQAARPALAPSHIAPLLPAFILSLARGWRRRGGRGRARAARAAGRRLRCGARGAPRGGPHNCVLTRKPCALAPAAIPPIPPPPSRPPANIHSLRQQPPAGERAPVAFDLCMRAAPVLLASQNAGNPRCVAPTPAGFRDMGALACAHVPGTRA